MSQPITYLPTDHAAETALVDLGLPAVKAAKLAAAYPSLRGMRDATEAMLRSAGGLTARQAKTVRAALRLAAVASSARDAWRAPATSPRAFAEYLRGAIGEESAECFAVTMLDARTRVIDTLLVHRGTLSRVDTHPREVMRAAIQCSAHSVIISHNHPSGDPEPSEADIELTRRMVDVGRLVGIPVLDHVIVSATGYTSLCERGLVFDAAV